MLLKLLVREVMPLAAEDPLKVTDPLRGVKVPLVLVQLLAIVRP